MLTLIRFIVQITGMTFSDVDPSVLYLHGLDYEVNGVTKLGVNMCIHTCTQCSLTSTRWFAGGGLVIWPLRIDGILPSVVILDGLD
jgi:hypothetical protein